jgi:hypothetical protein
MQTHSSRWRRWWSVIDRVLFGRRCECGVRVIHRHHALIHGMWVLWKAAELNADIRRDASTIPAARDVRASTL